MRARLRPRPPDRRVRRRPWREADYAALDFETTGLDYERDAIVSFGVVPVTGGRVVVGEAVHQLVHPEVPPSPTSQQIHELRPQDLADSPPLEVAREILGGAIQDRFLLVWFAEVEINFLCGIFGGRARRWAARCIDVRNLAIEAEAAGPAARDRPGYSLTSTAGRYGVPVAEPHQALDDALVTAQLFLVLSGKLPAAPTPSVADLLAAGRPARST